MKTKLWDKISDHMDSMVHMFTIALLHCFNFFPYNDAITTWNNEKAKRGLLALNCGKHNDIFSFGSIIVFWVLIIIVVTLTLSL